MEQFISLCQRVIQTSTNQVSQEQENLKQKEQNLVNQYEMGSLYEYEEKDLQNHICQLIIHYRNYILHNYLRKLIDKLLLFSEKIIQRNNEQDQLETYLGNLILTLEYIQQKLNSYGDLQILRKYIDDLINNKFKSNKYQISPIIIDLFNFQVLRDIYLTQFYKKYGFELEIFYKNDRKLSFDLDFDNDLEKIDQNKLNSVIKNTKRFQQEYQIIVTPDPSISSQLYPISEKNQKNFKSKSDIKINQLKIYSPQSKGSSTPTSNKKKFNFIPSQFKINTLKDNQSVIEYIISKKKKKGSHKLTLDYQFNNDKVLNLDSNQEAKDYEIFDEQSLFTLRNYLDTKFTSNKYERQEDITQLINFKQFF